jgi:hypothetical protein
MGRDDPGIDRLHDAGCAEQLALELAGSPVEANCAFPAV